VYIKTTTHIMFATHSTNDNTTVKNEILDADQVQDPNEPVPSTDNIDKMLDRERQRNTRDNWIKLDKTAKIQKLHVFAETYGKEHAMPSKDIKLLKNFFNSCLDKNKLSKSKDVVYNKDEMKIVSIPALHFNQLSHNFTLKIMDTKRVSTLKSLTPKRSTPNADVTTDNDD
jgi:hypothetical protein